MIPPVSDIIILSYIHREVFPTNSESPDIIAKNQPGP